MSPRVPRWQRLIDQAEGKSSSGSSFQGEQAGWVPRSRYAALLILGLGALIAWMLSR